MANKALFWYNYKSFVDEGTIKPLSPKTFALSGLITVCGLVLSLTIYCLVFPNSFVGENTYKTVFLYIVLYAWYACHDRRSVLWYIACFVYLIMINRLHRITSTP